LVFDTERGVLLSKFRLKIITPQKKHVDEEVKSVIAKGIEGFFQVLPQHIPMITGLKKGAFYYKSDYAFKKLKLGEGFVEITPRSVTVLVDSVESFGSDA